MRSSGASVTLTTPIKKAKKAHDVAAATAKPPKPSSALSLPNLPVELLLEIHTYCISPLLPLLNRHLYNLFRSTSTEYRIKYLLRVVSSSPSAHVQLERVVTFPLCTEEIYDRIMARQGVMWELALQQRAALPRRFSRHLKATTPIEGLFARLIDSDLFDVSANKGYALARAVFVSNAPLIDRLLAAGADASAHHNIAVMFAIRKMDGELVRKLIESDSFRPNSLPHHMRDRSNRALWMSDSDARDLINEAIKTGATDVVDYLSGQLGATPSMDTLRLLQ